MQVVFISDLRTGEDVPSIWIEDSYCTSGSCKISSSTGKSRDYTVRVTATDKAGNVGMGECKMIAGRNQASDLPDPLFLIAKVDLATEETTLFQ